MLKDVSEASEKSHTSIKVEKNAVLAISSGDKVVTEGEVSVDEQGSFSTGAGVTLWTQGIRMTEGNVTLDGTAYEDRR